MLRTTMKYLKNHRNAALSPDVPSTSSIDPHPKKEQESFKAQHIPKHAPVTSGNHSPATSAVSLAGMASPPGSWLVLYVSLCCHVL